LGGGDPEIPSTPRGALTLLRKGKTRTDPRKGGKKSISREENSHTGLPEVSPEV